MIDLSGFIWYNEEVNVFIFWIWRQKRRMNWLWFYWWIFEDDYEDEEGEDGSRW